MDRRYADRAHAGAVLAQHLAPYRDRSDVVVLGLARGGVPVAAAVAAVLDVPFDGLVVRKLGLPGRPELAMGAVVGVGGLVQTVRNDAVIRAAYVDDAAFARVREREVTELVRRERAYLSDRAPLDVAGRVVLLVDDGLATGASMRAAVLGVRRRAAGRVVVAVPFGSPRTCARLEQEADEVVAAWSPTGLGAVGLAYADFRATGDDEVRRLLAR